MFTTGRYSQTHLDCTERFSVSMATLHSSIHEVGPDVQKVLFLGTKHIDPLSPRNLAVQSVLLCYRSNSNELVSSDLPSGYPRDNGKCPVPLDIGEKFIICILQVVVSLVHNVWIEQAGQD